jgi:acyl-CoA dehydrogenase
MPLAGLVTEAAVMATVDGPTEVHQVTLARQVLKEYKPSDGLMPSAWLPPRIEAARARFAEALEHHVANL